MKINIRLALPSDAQDMAEIHMRSWEVAYRDIIPMEYIHEKNATRHELYKRVITVENQNSYIIEYDGKTVGIMKIASPQDEDLGDDYYELHYIYLHPNYYRLGIGTKSMEFAFNVARSMNKKIIIVWVLSENTNSIRFYEKCSFARDGKAKSVEYGKAIECIRMRKNL